MAEQTLSATDHNLIRKGMGELLEALINSKLDVVVKNAVSVSNLDELKAFDNKMTRQLGKEISKSLGSEMGKLAMSMGNAIDSIPSFPDTIQVGNFPQTPSDMSINNLSGIVRGLKDVQEQIRKINLSPIIQSPSVNVPESSVNVDMSGVEKAVKSMKTSMTKLEKLASASNQSFAEDLNNNFNNLGQQMIGIGGAEQRNLATSRDSTGVAQLTDRLMDGRTQLTPKFKVISGATSGNNTVVAAVSNKKIRVLQYVVVSAGDMTVRFESGASGTALTGVMTTASGTGVSAGYSPIGHFETAAGSLLNMELSAATQASGHLSYLEV